MFLRSTLPCMLAIALFASAPTAAVAAAPSADQIVEKARDRYDGKDTYSDVTLVLIDADGKRRERNLIFLEKKYGGDVKMTLYFTGPADVKGVALQSVSHSEASGQPDDQWIYLPAFRQVRRIAGNDKRGSFMGSQFAYIDLDKPRVSDYRQTLLGEEKYLGKDCYVVERVPASDDVIGKTGYYKVRMWVDKETDLVMKQTFYDAAGVLFKELNTRKVEKIQDIWTIMESAMTDHVNKRTSMLIFSNVRYNTGLGDQLFQQNIMRTGVNSGNLPALR